MIIRVIFPFVIPRHIGMVYLVFYKQKNHRDSGAHLLFYMFVPF